jgi:hypothetical protein
MQQCGDMCFATLDIYHKYFPNLAWVILSLIKSGIGAINGLMYLQILIRSSLVRDETILDDLFVGLYFGVNMESFMEERIEIFW